MGFIQGTTEQNLFPPWVVIYDYMEQKFPISFARSVFPQLRFFPLINEEYTDINTYPLEINPLNSNHIHMLADLAEVYVGANLRTVTVNTHDSAHNHIRVKKAVWTGTWCYKDPDSEMDLIDGKAYESLLRTTTKEIAELSALFEAIVRRDPMREKVVFELPAYQYDDQTAHDFIFPKLETLKNEKALIESVIKEEKERRGKYSF